MTIDTVKLWIKDYLMKQARVKPGNGEIADDTNFVESGLLDSLGFIGLIAAIEMHFGVTMDLVNQPVENLICVQPLAEMITKMLG
jgi:acyl carrier protein